MDSSFPYHNKFKRVTVYILLAGDQLPTSVVLIINTFYQPPDHNDSL